MLRIQTTRLGAESDWQSGVSWRFPQLLRAFVVEIFRLFGFSVAAKCLSRGKKQEIWCGLLADVGGRSVRNGFSSFMINCLCYVRIPMLRNVER